MEKAKTLVKAMQPFAHGNVSAQVGKVYAMNPADAKDLEKAGFVTLDVDGKAEPEQTQVALPAQKKQPGDVVVDDNADDLLGDGKAAPTLDNKAAPATRTKTTK